MQSLEFIVNVSLMGKNTAQYFIFDFLKFRYGENYDWIYYNYFCELWFSCYYAVKKIIWKRTECRGQCQTSSVIHSWGQIVVPITGAVFVSSKSFYGK